jgi:lysophospholipid acyltransferase
MTPDGKQPLPSKRYYDAFTWALTQCVFAFTTAPFVLLSFSGTMRVWSRVYFFTLIGVAASFAAFSRSLPIRRHLQKMQGARQPASSNDNIEKVAKEEVEADLKRRQSALSMSSDASSLRKAPTLGIADDPEAEVEEIVREVTQEIEERRRRGSVMQGFDIKTAVREKMKEVQKGPRGAGALGGIGGLGKSA